jgi:aspartyl protease family protein
VNCDEKISMRHDHVNDHVNSPVKRRLTPLLVALVASQLAFGEPWPPEGAVWEGEPGRVSPLEARDIKASEVSEQLEIEVLALFEDAALLLIDGEQTLLRTGEKTRSGVRLVGADSSQAEVAFGEQTWQLSVHQRVGARYEPPGERVVTIPRDSMGHFRTTGSINGVPTVFLIDTGATTVAMNATAARRLGIDPSEGVRQRVETASGMAWTTRVTLDAVVVGDILLTNVPAMILGGDYPRDVLLGMSFLQGVEISEQSGLMVLKSKL